MLRTKDIARAAHEANRAYCLALGDTSQLPWDEAPDWQKESAINGVLAIADSPHMTPEQSHERWFEYKFNDGWKWGSVKDVDKKEHPCMLPYAQLPAAQRVKDKLFTAVVKALM